MKNLAKYFPFVTVLFTETTSNNSMTSSEAAMVKNENKNQATKILDKFSFTLNKIYKTVREVFSGTSNAFVKTSVDAETCPLPEDFKELEKVVDLYSQSAVLGHGIQRKDKIISEIALLDNDKIAKIEGFDIPELKVLVPSRIAFNVDAYCRLDKIEELYAQAPTELISRIATYYFKALKAEAQAAIYSKQLTKDSFLRQLSSADKTIEVSKSTGISTILYFENKELVVDPTLYTATEEELQKKFQDAQKETNGYMKQIKDAARELALEFHKEYNEKMRQYNQDTENYYNALREFNNKCEQVKTELLQEAAKLLIVTA